MPGVHQPDPPGLIHDDLRLLPPWRGSSLLWGQFRIADKLANQPKLRNAVFASEQTLPFVWAVRLSCLGCPSELSPDPD